MKIFFKKKRVKMDKKQMNRRNLSSNGIFITDRYKHSKYQLINTTSEILQ